MNLTQEQQQFVNHAGEAFVEACPGAGKTRSIVARLARITEAIPPRKGVALLSFTNSAVEEFVERCRALGLDAALRHPGFIGTFDSFIRHFFVQPGGIGAIDVRPQVVDSWDSLGIEVRLRGQHAYAGPGVSLDSFNPDDGQIDPEAIGHNGLRAHVIAHQEQYVRAARARRSFLRTNGYLSAADARVEVCRKLQDANWSASLGCALAARFHEVIVDEAQDCNPLDLQILRWLRDHDLSVVTVSDPDQAIYGFRHGDPANLRQFAETYAQPNRLGLTGNFRSTRRICALAATLRANRPPDEATGEYAGIDIPVHIIAYDGASVPGAVGDKFVELHAQVGLSVEGSIVLAHSRRAACQAAGYFVPSDATGTSKVALLARQVNDFWASTASSRTREGTLRAVERMILAMMGKIEDGESPSRAAEKYDIDQRWLRRTALELVTRLGRVCDSSDAGRNEWIASLHDTVDSLDLEYAGNQSARRFFRRPRNSEWSRPLHHTEGVQLRWSTIHEAKGREYNGVCLVVPPDRGQRNHTTQLFDSWENYNEEEAKRVIYVGTTRAMKFLSIAIPAAFLERLRGILNRAQIAYEVHEI